MYLRPAWGNVVPLGWQEPACGWWKWSGRDDDATRPSRWDRLQQRTRAAQPCQDHTAGLGV